MTAGSERTRSEEPPPTYSFAIALTVLLAVMLAEEPIYGALLATLLLTVPVVVLLLVRPTREVLSAGRSGDGQHPDAGMETR